MSKIEVNQISSQCGSTLTIGQSGDTVTLACGATQSGFGRTGTVNWDTTAKTTNFTAVSGNGYFVNTTSGAITATLPAGSAGAIVAFADYGNTFNTNNLTISPDGSEKIGGIAADATVSTKGASTTFVYVDGTQGWKQVNDATLNTIGYDFISATGGTITTSGNYKIHTFTSPGTFCVSSISSSAPNNEVSYLVVAGGAGGGGTPGNAGGGGGAGGFRESKSGVDCYSASPLEGSTNITVTATAFPITVGAGGGGGTGPVICAPTGFGSNGSNSVFSTITSTGGGGGGYGYPSSNGPFTFGKNGGAGGGAGGGNIDGAGGSGNQPPTTPSQGFPGAPSVCGPNSPDHAGGGGGGAIAAGSTCNPGNACGSKGGNGATTSISGSPTAYAGGGGAGYCSGISMPQPAPGGIGGGGSSNTAGTANTGGGGGGGNGPNGAGAAGGSGIVIIRYKYQ